MNGQCILAVQSSQKDSLIILRHYVDEERQTKVFNLSLSTKSSMRRRPES